MIETVVALGDVKQTVNNIGLFKNPNRFTTSSTQSKKLLGRLLGVPFEKSNDVFSLFEQLAIECKNHSMRYV